MLNVPGAKILNAPSAPSAISYQADLVKPTTPAMPMTTAAIALSTPKWPLTALLLLSAKYALPAVEFVPGAAKAQLISVPRALLAAISRMACVLFVQTHALPV